MFDPDRPRPPMPVYSWQTETSAGLYECRLWRLPDPVGQRSDDLVYRATVTLRGIEVFRSGYALRPTLAAITAIDFIQSQVLSEIEREVHP